MDKKGQIVGQVFIFIMAALIIGVIVLIGYNAISKTLSKSCQIEQISFKTKLESLIDRSNGYGSVTKQSLIAPCQYETVCFVDATEIGTTNPLNTCTNKVIQRSVADGDLKNIFVSTSKKTVPIGYAPLLRTDDPNDCTCITQKSKNFQLTLLGIGQGTIARSSTYTGTSFYEQQLVEID